jgi:tyrosyl-tRNA synthetase
LRLFTFLPLDEIAQLEKLPGAEINQAKERLAYEATRITHGEPAARDAQQTARARFAGDGQDSGPSLNVVEPTRVADLLQQASFVSSRRDAKRQLESGGVSLGDERLTSDRLVEPAELPKLLSLGKRKIRLIADS